MGTSFSAHRRNMTVLLISIKESDIFIFKLYWKLLKIQNNLWIGNESRLNDWIKLLLVQYVVTWLFYSRGRRAAPQPHNPITTTLSSSHPTQHQINYLEIGCNNNISNDSRPQEREATTTHFVTPSRKIINSSSASPQEHFQDGESDEDGSLRWSRITTSTESATPAF